MNISKKELESKISKYLRKANRLKSTRLKLEKIDELLEILHEASATYNTSGNQAAFGDSLKGEEINRLLDAYIELCYIHKLKFQTDALFAGVKNDLNTLEQHPDQMTQSLFDSLLRRTYVVLDIDPKHPEAQFLIQALTEEYPQYAENSSARNISLNISPYQLPKLFIEIDCNVEYITGNNKLQAIYKTYQRPSVSNTKGTPSNESTSACHLRFYLDQLKEFELFHEALRMKPDYTITVNGQQLDEKSFTGWFQCYKRSLKANTPQYCYGASPFTFNLFGCHKLQMPDVAKDIEHCWFHYGALDQESGLFLVATERIANQIHARLAYCGFCPALTQEKLAVGLALLPTYLNPECDARWRYLYTADGKRTGVIPSGNDIAISSDREPQIESLMEVGTTPYVEKVLHYLQSADMTNLAETAYRDLSHCLHCGELYKPHTMICSKCKTAFWRHALKNPEQILENFNYTRKPELLLPEGKTTDLPQKPVKRRIKTQKEPVSFDLLWSDPEIQQILSKPREGQNKPHNSKNTSLTPSESAVLLPSKNMRQQPSEPKKALIDYEEAETVSLPPAQSSPTPSSNRFDLHGKLRSLVSKRYRERKAIEQAFSHTNTPPLSAKTEVKAPGKAKNLSPQIHLNDETPARPSERRSHILPEPQRSDNRGSKDDELINAVKKLKKSKLSKRGVVRVIYHATMDKDICPLCNYLDGMVMDPDDPATDIFSPPLYPGCTCSREYVLKTEKPNNWPEVNFRFPPKELLIYLDKK